jgi:Domain of Unknown Function (DUF928)
MLIPFFRITLLSGLAASIFFNHASSFAAPSRSARPVVAPLGFEPSPKNPKRTTGSGSRDPGWCPQDKGMGASFTVLNSSELTEEARPSFQVHVAPTSARSLEFSLFDAQGKGVYQTVIPLNTPPETLRIPIPDTAAPLVVNQSYRWVVSLVCQPNNRLQDRNITGLIRRVPTTGQRDAVRKF